MKALFVLVAAGAMLVSGCGSSRRALVLDESRPTYKGIGLGSSVLVVEAALGKPSSLHGGFAPAGRLPSEVGVPAAVPVPAGVGRARPLLLRYPQAAFLLARGRVFAMLLTDGQLRTRRGVAIGDHIAGGAGEIWGRELLTSASRRIGVELSGLPRTDRSLSHPLFRWRSDSQLHVRVAAAVKSALIGRC